MIVVFAWGSVGSEYDTTCASTLAATSTGCPFKVRTESSNFTYNLLKVLELLGASPHTGRIGPKPHAHQPTLVLESIVE